MVDYKYGHTFKGVDYSVQPHELAEYSLADDSNVIPNQSGLFTGRRGTT